MLEELRIQNFKGWRDTGTVRMAPITLFFGTNSSGKSSIGHFLMMLKQTVDSADRKTAFNLGNKNSAIQLGSFQEIVYGRNRTDTISFEYQWKLSEPLKVINQAVDKSKIQFQGNRMRFCASVALPDGEKDHTPKVRSMEYTLIQSATEEELKVKMDQKKEQKNQYNISAEGYTLKRNLGRVWSPGSPIRFYGFPDEVSAYHQNADFVKDFDLVHEKLFQSIFYLGPLREEAERIYSWSGDSPDSVGYRGQNTVSAILAATGEGRKIKLPGTISRSFQEIVASELVKLGLLDRFKVNQIGKRQNYEVKVHTKGAISDVDIPDVGFGISQVLPVLVQCFYAPSNSIIIMEQPEIHLHPSAQAALADVMIDVIHSRENGRDRNIQLIIETHSEHFLRRLQRRIAEGTLHESKLSAYFADVTTVPARLRELEIDEYGSVRNWPRDFFGDEMGDITAQAEGALKKRIARQGGQR